MKVELSFILISCIGIICVKAASLGDAILNIDTNSMVFPSENDSELEIVKREAEAEPIGLRTHHLHHLHHHNHHHHGGEEQYISKPTSCSKCGGGGGGNVATFAQSSAGTISTNAGLGGHGGLGSPSVSQSASYNFGPFSASFSSSQSGGSGGFYGGLF